MTEKQGGSDLRQTQTTARFAGSDQRRPRLSAQRPQVVLLGPAVGRLLHAGADEGRRDAASSCRASCPTARATACASSASRTSAATAPMPRARSSITTPLAWLVGEEGHGIREILSHAHLTRLDFAIGSAGLMRQALTLALNHAQTRQGFGLALADQPMMTNILADLAIECEASTLMAFRVAQAIDGMQERYPAEAHRARRDPAGQVLELQARAVVRRRGAGVPRRQRVHRGEPDGAALPRGAPQRASGRAPAT